MSKHMEVIMVHIAKDNQHTHMSKNEGRKRHGDKALEALLSEFGQLYKYNIVDSQHTDDLSKEVR